MQEIEYISLFIAQSCFSVPKDIRLNSRHYLMKIRNRIELQNIAFNHSADVDYKEFYRKCTSEPYSVLTIDFRLSADNPLRSKKIF